MGKNYNDFNNLAFSKSLRNKKNPSIISFMMYILVYIMIINIIRRIKSIK